MNPGPLTPKVVALLPLASAIEMTKLGIMSEETLALMNRLALERLEREGIAPNG